MLRIRNETWHAPFLDLLFILVAVLIALINPDKSKNEADTRPGSIHVEIRWPDKCPTDVDLWVKHDDKFAVGYTYQNGPLFNLIRDDLGKDGDLGRLNYENTYSRGYQPGQYHAMIHHYSSPEKDHCQGNVPVDWKISIQTEDYERVIGQGTETLKFVGHSVTLLNWKLDEDGYVVKDSMNNVFVRIGPKVMKTPNGQF